MIQTPPPTLATGPDRHRRPRRRGSPAKGTPRGRRRLQGPKPGCPPARSSGPPDAHNAPGLRSGYRGVSSRGPLCARTPTWKASSGGADSAAVAAGGGPGGRAGGQTSAQAGQGAEARAPPARSRGLQHRQRRRRRRRLCCASSGPPRRSPSSPTGGARWRGGAPRSPPPAPAGSPGRSGTAGGGRSRCAPAPAGTLHRKAERASGSVRGASDARGSTAWAHPPLDPRGNPWCPEMGPGDPNGASPGLRATAATPSARAR